MVLYQEEWGAPWRTYSVGGRLRNWLLGTREAYVRSRVQHLASEKRYIRLEGSISVFHLPTEVMR